VIATIRTQLALSGGCPLFCIGIANSEQAPSGNIDEIVVTEQKQAERLRNVPIAIAAPSSTGLAERGVRQAGDIAAAKEPE
jgi:hypothetical protein